ncbi:hypothetical protein BDZ94DRAFT_1280271 [Collybia nuda]|uniref:Uncharacterized protein n=1 Tax=Collybia nuda TaxID=64659 RepID=A0A9P6CPG9_9AGAR|nr:hypothetical protein BDZ94DRAFT_1280271 [Collybia nuda]
MSTKDSYSGSRTSQGSHRFRDSTHLIPAADSDGKRAKRFDPWIMNLFVVVGIPVSMLALGIGLEVGLSISTKNGGFKVPPNNVIEIVSSQFLLAFVPTILVAPYAFMWRELDWMLRWYQPYIVLWKGNSTAEESLLLDYDLSAFVAAAGFAEASAFNGFPDPPFVRGGWATTEFLFPTGSYLNGSMVLNTTGIQTNPNCANPAKFNLISNPSNTFTVDATSVEGCAHNLTFNPNYGVDDVTCPGTEAIEPEFSPVMFWFFHNKDDGKPEAKAVFCSPSVKAFNIKVTANLDTHSLSDVVPTGDFVPENVTGDHAYNGLFFTLPNPRNTFIEARASAIQGGISGAIFQTAAESDLGLQGTFDLPNQFMDITTQIYRQHLSIVALSIYFLKDKPTIKAEITSFVPILWIDPLPAHTLALVLFLTGFVGIILQVLHRRDRRKLLLAAPPGSIAAVMSLTSRSGFGDLLLPYDDEITLEQKLEGLRFRMDRRTGAIVADDIRTEQDFMGPDDAMMSLLGQGHQRDTIPASASSSTLAFQAAAGYPPWVGPLKTPYDR